MLRRRALLAATNSGAVDPTMFLHFDAASYPGTGNVATDLNQGNNDGTLNNITWSSSQGGSFVFNGSNSSIFIPSYSSGNFACEAWIKLSGTSAYGVFGGDRADGGSDNNQLLAGAGIISTAINDFIASTSSAGTVTTGVWYQIVWARSGSSISVYKNGSLNHIGTSASNLTLAAIGLVGRSALTGKYFNGSMTVLRMYKRSLSASEVSQNFEALRGRHGI